MGIKMAAGYNNDEYPFFFSVDTRSADVTE
jgi:hypothetical protein